jgi:uncharacterized C2H2 Zn-finger protein
VAPSRSGKPGLKLERKSGESGNSSRVCHRPFPAASASGNPRSKINGQKTAAWRTIRLRFPSQKKSDKSRSKRNNRTAMRTAKFPMSNRFADMANAASGLWRCSVYAKEFDSSFRELAEFIRDNPSDRPKFLVVFRGLLPAKSDFVTAVRQHWRCLGWPELKDFISVAAAWEVETAAVKAGANLIQCPQCSQSMRASRLMLHVLRVHPPSHKRSKHKRKKKRRSIGIITAFRGGYSDRGPGAGWHRTSSGWKKG